jgi:hypothetical protein
MGTRGWIGVGQRRRKKMRTRRGYKPTSEHKERRLLVMVGCEKPRRNSAANWKKGSANCAALLCL